MTKEVKTLGNNRGDAHIDISKAFRHKTLEERAKEREEDFEPLEEIDRIEPAGSEIW